jgi:hypothetical protein
MQSKKCQIDQDHISEEELNSKPTAKANIQSPLQVQAFRFQLSAVGHCYPNRHCPEHPTPLSVEFIDEF